MSINQIKEFITKSSEVLKGKEDKVELVITNLLASGHTLIEDTPGVGKTTLAKLISKGFNLDLSRIQFTNDLLPSDIIGGQIFDKNIQRFYFHKGPIFGELILADELNRASPKTQSALLQVMEERKINIDGEEFILPECFNVIATQNPNSQIGTNSLPESQLDRFSMKIDIGHLDKKSTLKMLSQGNIESSLSKFESVVTKDQLMATIQSCQKVHIEENILEMIYKLLDFSRVDSQFLSLSNRAGLDLVKVMKAFAFIKERDYVIPDDLIYLFPFVCGHRMVIPDSSSIELERELSEKLIKLL